MVESSSGAELNFLEMGTGFLLLFPELSSPDFIISSHTRSLPVDFYFPNPHDNFLTTYSK